MDKLLAALEGQPDRGARFKTVIALTTVGGTLTFEGICAGIHSPAAQRRRRVWLRSRLCS